MIRFLQKKILKTDFRFSHFASSKPIWYKYRSQNVVLVRKFVPGRAYPYNFSQRLHCRFEFLFLSLNSNLMEKVLRFTHIKYSQQFFIIFSEKVAIEVCFLLNLEFSTVKVKKVVHYQSWKSFRAVNILAQVRFFKQHQS